MRTSRGGVGVVMGCAVQFVFAVPGFAQSHNEYRSVFAVDHIAIDALRPYSPGPASEITDVGIPANFELPSSFVRLVESMLQRSPTFRLQCRRIANAGHLEVTLRVAGNRRIERARAVTRIVKEKHRLHASIEVLSLEGLPELIAHELEHVIEQLDGIDLPSRAARSGGDVRPSSGEAFETTRALRVGRTVAEELER
jgi:hypothetical protein